MSVLINGLIKWREDKMVTAGAGPSIQWQRRMGGGVEGQKYGGY